MTWTAEAPVPMIATRLPVRSWLWSQRAVCIVRPAKDSTPSMSGRLGMVSAPLALTRNRAQTVSPESSSTRHRSASASNVAPSTRVLNRILGRRPYLSAQCSA